MTRGLNPPSVTGDLSSLKKRVTDLERKLDDLGRSRPYLGIPFTLAGSIYASESSPWTSPIKARIYELVVLLGTAGTTTTTVNVNVNGLSSAALSLNSGETYKKSTVSIKLAPDQDIVTVECVTAGTGAKDLDVIVRVT